MTSPHDNPSVSLAENAGQNTDRQAIRLLQIGCGNMGGALLDAAMATDRLDQSVIIDPRATRPDLPAYIRLMPDLTKLPTRFRADVLLLAVKPQMIAELAPLIAGYRHQAVIVSIMAGVTMAQLAALFGADAPIIRTMPNTPAAVRSGLSALMANDQVTPEQKRLTSLLFDAAGDTVWLTDEGQFDAFTGLAGSGPAYLFHMVEALEAAGVAAGLAPEIAAISARKTIIGAAALLHDSAESPARLRENVTSPNGTTAAGLAALMADDDGLTALLAKTVKAAADRSKALAQSD
ncbi:MAG: pyrroline-5-carboxylate reductase [Pseudomonadota bacterium]